MRYAIETHSLTKQYGDVRAVDEVDLKIGRGTIHGILGPNGAGKSTLIGILGTLVRPTRGKALLDGVDVARNPLRARRMIGFAMQEAGVDTLATGREFLILQARLYGIPRREANTRADELLEIFKLKEAQHKRIGRYSGGMKRRMDLAAALIHEPPILFLDEPSEGLDPQSRQQLWDLLELLNRDTGMTTLLSTHYMEEADRLCDRLTILDQGRIVTEGSPQELKSAVGGQAILLDYGTQETTGLARAKKILEHVRDVDRTQAINGTLHVTVEAVTQSIPEILGRLKAQDASPRSLRIREPTLNDVYLKHTGRRYEEGA